MRCSCGADGHQFYGCDHCSRLVCSLCREKALDGLDLIYLCPQCYEWEDEWQQDYDCPVKSAELLAILNRPLEPSEMGTIVPGRVENGRDR